MDSTNTKPKKGDAPRKFLFDPGPIFATPGALASWTLGEFRDALLRHLSGDWGEMCEEDKRRNNEALVDGSRIFSAYRTEGGEKVWVITEAEDDDGVRHATTFLLPDEY